MTTKIPATIVTGFLGAGKTSLVRHLVEHAGGKRLALLINEFGDLGVDRALLGGCGIADCAEEDVIELANGCICCTVADDFLPAMRTILARDPAPDHIVIETSGLALPKPLVAAFNWPEVRNRLTVDGVLVVADAAAVLAGRFAHDPDAVQEAREADAALDHETPLEELFEEQLGCGDLVLVNKSDQVAAGDRAAVETLIRAELRPGVRLVWTSHGKVDPAVALGLGVGAETDLANRPSHHDGGEEHGHDEFESFVLAGPASGRPGASRRASARRDPRPRHPAGQGLPGRRRQAHAPCRPGGGRAGRPLLRPAMADGRDAPGRAGGDRAQGPGPCGHRQRHPRAARGVNALGSAP